MNTLLLFLSVVAATSAATYKGTKSLKVGKKNYKCTFKIAYTSSKAACGKRTVKCKPIPKKPLKFAIKTKDATISVATAKNKITACKVVSKAPVVTTQAPLPSTQAPVVPPAPGTTEELDCTCYMPIMTQPLETERSVPAKVLKNVVNRQGLLGNLLASNGGLLGGGAPAPAANGLAGLLSGGAGGGAVGGLQNAIMQAALQNMINQAIKNPDSLQEMINVAVSSGMAEQTVNSFIQSGQIESLAQGLMESGKAEEILGSMGEGIMNQEAVQNAVNNNDLGNIPSVDDLSEMLDGMNNSNLESVLQGVDVQGMDWQMKCNCRKADPPVVG